MHLELGMRLALVALHQHEIDRAELLEQRFERKLGVSAQLVHERPTVGRADQHLGRPRHPMGMGVLAGLVDVEGVMGVLEGRYLEPAGDDTGDYLGEERGLARAAPAGEADDAHAGIISGVADVKASPPPWTEGLRPDRGCAECGLLATPPPASVLLAARPPRVLWRFRAPPTRCGAP